MTQSRLLLAAAAMGFAAACTPAEKAVSGPAEVERAEAPAEEAAPLTVNVLDCGTIEVTDLDAFSSAGDWAGQTDTLTDTCFLINHPKGRMLWDLGLPGMLVGAGTQTVGGIFKVTMDTSITQQLADLGLTPGDIDYISLSHDHFDHVGQVDQVSGATWIVQEDEYNDMFRPEDAEQPDPQLAAMWALFKPLTAQKITGDYDVFGDGTVTIIELPGHTPGHSVLQLMMPETGPVLLSGDLYHRTESRQLRRVPRFNWDEPKTLASMDAFETRAQELGAKVIIQHEPDDIAPLGGMIR
ncbi:MAG: N-acyl homoserine lactonase family protein [Hyphomonas sp.]|uniref:N-acyl homoserine lactonase family protein n=1 Tax=Hyphomonas sp. TaxID=87 RepID=UPI0035289BDB